MKVLLGSLEAGLHVEFHPTHTRIYECDTCGALSAHEFACAFCVRIEALEQQVNRLLKAVPA